MYSYFTKRFTVLHSYNTAIVLEQELIFLGKPCLALVLTRFRPTARLSALLGRKEAARAAIPEQRSRHPFLGHSQPTMVTYGPQTPTFARCAGRQVESHWVK